MHPTPTPLDRFTADGAVPRSFDEHYGDGLTRTVSFGGGGLFFVAWQLAYLSTAASAGIDVRGAERIVGTSAGSLVAAVVASGRLRLVQSEVAALARMPAVLAHLAPAGELHPSQQRALALFQVAVDAEPATVRAIGHAALAAVTPSPARMRHSASVVTGRGRLSSTSLAITAVDAFTGERCVLGAATGTTVAAAAAASGAVPGLFAPQPISDRRLMDGGVSGTGVHLDLVAGARRTLVLSLSDDSDVGTGHADLCARRLPGRADRGRGHRDRGVRPVARGRRPDRAHGAVRRAQGVGDGCPPGTTGRRRAPGVLGLTAGPGARPLKPPIVRAGRRTPPARRRPPRRRRPCRRPRGRSRRR